MTMTLVLRDRTGRTAAVAVAAVLSACSYVPDALNPVEWYNDSSDYFFGADQPVTASNQPPPGSDQPFPSLSSVPARPQPAPVRPPMVEGLVADRTAGQRYATEPIQRQGDAVSPLRRDLTAPPTGVATPPTGAAATTGLGTTPPPGASPSAPPPPPSAARPVPPASTAGAGPQLLRPPAPPQQTAAASVAPARGAPSGATSVEEVFRSNLAQRLPPPAAGGEQLAPVEMAQANAMPVTPMPPAQGPRQFGSPSAAQPAPQPAPQSPLFPRSQLPANSVAPTLDRFDTVFVSSSGVQLGTGTATSAASRPAAPAPSTIGSLRPAPSGGSSGEPASTASPVAPTLNAGPSDGEITAFLSRQPGTGAPANRIATVVFADGSAGLDARDREVLRSVSGLYRERSPATIRVAGHASHRTRTMAPVRHQMANYKVSLDRANAVKEELVRLGVPRDKIVADARSDGEPMYYEVMPSGEAGNRRTEIYFFGS